MNTRERVAMKRERIQEKRSCRRWNLLMLYLKLAIFIVAMTLNFD